MYTYISYIHVHIHICMPIYICSSVFFLIINVQFFKTVQSIEKSDFLEKASQIGVKSLKCQFLYGLEISYYLGVSRPEMY